MNLVTIFFIALTVFLALVVGLTAVAMRYLIPKPAYKRSCLLLLVIDLILVGAMIASYATYSGADSGYRSLVLQVVTVAIMGQLGLTVLVGAAVGARALGRLYKRMINHPVDTSRRKLLSHAMLFPAAAAGGALYGNLYERNHTIDRRWNIAVPGMDKSLEGYRIAQISDVHIGPFFSLERLSRLLERVAADKPDVLVITGDIFDDNRLNEEAVRIVNQFTGQFPQGIWYCRGNHEHIRGIERIEALLEQSQIHELVNGNALIIPGRTPLYFAGVDYPMDRPRFDELKTAYTKEAMAGIPDHAVTVLLAHHPAFIDDGAEYGVNLVLSGHTHGGQLGILGIPLVPPVFGYMRGMYPKGKTYGYVHCGNGSWFPFRFGCPPEVAHFTLWAG